MATAATMNTVDVDGLRIAYRELGAGPAVLLLHGWPTSSQLWRQVMVPIAQTNRAVAVDLPGFGASDKPLDRRYDFALFERTIDGLLAELGIDQTALAVHDLGGPVGVHWAIRNPQRVTKLALLNTLLYPELSEAVVEFVRLLRDPESRDRLTSPAGLESIMRRGLVDESHLTDEVLQAVREPSRTETSRRALARRRDPAGAGGLRRDRQAPARAPDAGPHHLRGTRPVPARRGRHHGARPARPPAGGDHRTPGLRALPPSGSPTAGRGAAGALCRPGHAAARPGTEPEAALHWTPVPPPPPRSSGH